MTKISEVATDESGQVIGVSHHDGAIASIFQK